MQDRIRRYLDAAARGADYLLSMQNPDGSFIREDLQADVYHKAPQALLLTGHPAAANRLLEWVKRNDLREGGRLHHFDAGLALYKTNWLCQGAHRMGRFDISMPVMRFILKCQAPCGGFYQWPEMTTVIEPVCSAWGGMTSLYMGHVPAAQKAGQFLRSMLEQQPDTRRFYVQTDAEGALNLDGPFVDADQPGQAYYCPGIAALFCIRLHLATGDEDALDTGMRLLLFQMNCADDAFAYPTAGKSAVAAATLYAVLGDTRARDAACSMGDYLVSEQSAEGWWRNPHSDSTVVRLDHTAEFVVFLSEIAAMLSVRS
ncbi:MAG: hypothetical protein KBI47_06195 [Armatimonadetes bacterium]|jgi:hypothetical protein|nr:hypothetical protein [Armatimonadota bacterium]MDI9585464.1 prenyltransferase/squalene oxidase repeat-containing protein [Acidobacteriota bacterium]